MKSEMIEALNTVLSELEIHVNGNIDGVITFKTKDPSIEIPPIDPPEPSTGPPIDPPEPSTGPPIDPDPDNTAVYVNSLIGKGVNGYFILTDQDLKSNWPPEYYAQLKEAGFDSVRIVVLRGGIDYLLSNEKLENIKLVVDLCIDHDLFPVIDYHAIPKWFKAYTPQQGEVLINNWSLLTDYFKDYKYDDLVFEIANEPCYIQPAEWNKLAADTVAAIRNFDKERIIMVASLDWDHISGLKTLELPDDDKLILTLHYYEPGWVNKQNCPWDGALNGTKYAGTEWQNIQPMVDNLEDEFTDVFSFQTKHNNIPVNMGEWGTMIFSDEDNRVKYSTLMARWFESKGFSHFHWEYDQHFGIMKNPELGYAETREFYTEVVDAIIRKELILSDYTSEVLIDQPEFVIADWSTYQSGGGSLYLSMEGNELVANVGTTDYNYLNARAVSPKFDLEKNNIYRVSYTVKSGNTKNIAHKYSGNHSWYYTYNLGDTFVNRVETYIMPTETQYGAKVEFLLGSGAGKVYFKDFKLEKLLVGLPIDPDPSTGPPIDPPIEPVNKTIIWTQDFQDTPIQTPYSMDQLKMDFPWKTYKTGRNSYCDTNEYISVEEKDGKKRMKHFYKEGNWGVGLPWESGEGKGTGVNIFSVMHETDGWEELYLSYNILFEDGFDWGLGGKLPGFISIPMNGGGGSPDPDEGCMAIMMWQPDGKIKYYSYFHEDFDYDYGRGPVIPASFTTGRWYNVTQRLVNSSPWSKDGMQEIFIDGVLNYSWTGVQTREQSDKYLQTISFNTFQGGGSPSYAPDRDGTMWIEGCEVFYLTGDDVVTGKTPSPVGRDISEYLTYWPQP